MKINYYSSEKMSLKISPKMSENIFQGILVTFKNFFMKIQRLSTISVEIIFKYLKVQRISLKFGNSEMSLKKVFPSKRKWIEVDTNGFVLFISNPNSDLFNPFLSN